MGERLTANIANVGSLSSVDQHVLLLSGLPSKSLSTDRTGERFHPGVHSHMRVQVTSPESLTASWTEYLFPGFMPRKMLLQVLLCRHTPSTNSTDKFRFVMPIFHVSLESVKILAEVTADVAHDRRSFAVVLLHVVIQGLLYFELLAARIARVIVIARVQPNVMILQGAFVVALVLAHAALVHLLLMILLDVGDQITSEAEGLRAVGAFVPMLLQMLGKVALFQEFAATVIALYVCRLFSSRSIFLSYDPRTKLLSRQIRILFR